MNQLSRRGVLLGCSASIAAAALPITAPDPGPVISFRAIPESGAITLPQACAFKRWTICNTGDAPLTIHGARRPFVLRPRHGVTFKAAEARWQISVIGNADSVSALAAAPAPAPPG